MYNPLMLFSAVSLILTQPVITMAIPPGPSGYYVDINEQAAAPQNITYIARPDAVWFGDINQIFARETDAVVRDILTGRTFEIRRTFGTNHADIEPLTVADAQTMYEIWGGHSWERRAVLVYVDGYILPGSLTNFPHAGLDSAPALTTVNGRSGGYGRGLNFDAVKGNGVDGHMCLHFAGSLIHGSNRSNAAHQQRVREAAEYLRENY